MNENSYCVYRHVFPNGKLYIGITSQKPENRWRGGKHYNALVERAIRKYGWGNVLHEVLFRGLCEHDAKQKEIELIKLFNTKNPKCGYNLTDGGDGMRGFKTREETKSKLSEINKGKRHTDESKRKMSESRKGEKAYWYGKEIPQYVKEKISAKNKGKQGVWTGKKMPDEARANMSLNHADVSGDKNPRATRVQRIDANNNVVTTYSTIAEAARKNQCNVCTVRRRCNGSMDKHGYIWRYAEEVTL